MHLRTLQHLKTLTNLRSNSLGKNISDTTKMMSGVPLHPQDVSQLLIGEKILMLRLPNAGGMPFDLREAVAAKPTILIFYRGG
ncbi:hypothetical protein ACVWYG_001481 [Pedobacter sp. UYEF25]